VVVVLAGDVELLGIGELRRIPVRRVQKRQHGVTWLDHVAIELDLLAGSPDHRGTMAWPGTTRSVSAALGHSTESGEPRRLHRAVPVVNAGGSPSS
jgi:hypothetical protein